MKEGTIPPSVMLVRLLQVGLIAFSIYSVSKFLNGTSQALDFALNRPVSEADQKRTLVNELPRFFLATDPNAIVAEALENEDYGLAGLYINYAQSLPFNMRGRVTIEPALIEQYEESQSWLNWGTRQASGCFNGLVYRTAETTAALGCQAGSNFFLIGDAADLAKEGLSWANGGEVDDVIVGLSLVGAGSSIIPMLYPAAGGAGVAKSVVKAGAKTFPIAKPMRAAVRNAVDLPALKAEISTYRNWRSLRRGWKNFDYAKYVRPKQADALVSGMGNMVVLGKNTGPDVAIRTFKQVDNFDDLASLTKVMKLAKPAVAYAKFTYKSSLAMWGALVVLGVAVLEYALRRTMWNKLKTSGATPAPFWAKGGMGAKAVWVSFAAALVLAGAHFVLHSQWEAEKVETQNLEAELRDWKSTNIYMMTAIRDFSSGGMHNEEKYQSLVASGLLTNCGVGSFKTIDGVETFTANYNDAGGLNLVDADLTNCKASIDSYFARWPLKL